MRVLEDMKEVLEDQLKKISKKGDSISPQELDNAYKAIDIIKDITTIEAMQKAEKEQEEMKKSQEGYSQAGGSSYGYSMHMPMYPYMMSEDGYAGNAYARGRGYDGNSNNAYAGGSYDGTSNDYSGRRGRDARTGRYVSRDGGSYDGSYDYSGAEEQEKQQLKQQIKQMEQKLNNM